MKFPLYNYGVTFFNLYISFMKGFVTITLEKKKKILFRLLFSSEGPSINSE